MEKAAIDTILVVYDKAILAVSDRLAGIACGQVAVSGSGTALLGFAGRHALCSDRRYRRYNARNELVCFPYEQEVSVPNDS